MTPSSVISASGGLALQGQLTVMEEEEMQTITQGATPASVSYATGDSALRFILIVVEVGFVT